MQRLIQFVVFAGFLVSLAQSPDVIAQPAVEFPPVSDNAALQYWQAFATIPTLDADQEKLLQNWATVPLDEAATKLLDQSQTSLMFLHRGAQRRECDWGLDYRDGGQLFLPHLIRARTLARIAALDARQAFENKDYKRAHDDAFGMVTLARHVGKDHTIVNMLVCFAIEGTVVDLAAPYLPEVQAPYADVLEECEALPPSPPLAQAVLGEKRMAYTVLNQLAEAEHRRPGSWRETWKSILGGDVGGAADPLQSAVKFEEVLDLVEKFQSVYDELAELMALPPAEFDARYPEFAKRASATSPVAEVLLPAVEKTVAVQRRSEARLAMLLAAIAVIESGPEELAGIKDPFGDGPFEYRKLDTGFQLSSKLLEDGKPVTLEIGRKTAVPSQ
jgi:hypothetical protein